MQMRHEHIGQNDTNQSNKALQTELSLIGGGGIRCANEKLSLKQTNMALNKRHCLEVNWHSWIVAIDNDTITTNTTSIQKTPEKFELAQSICTHSDMSAVRAALFNFQGWWDELNKRFLLFWSS